MKDKWIKPRHKVARKNYIFSCKELEELSIKEMEVCYKEQCHEGDLLKAKVKKKTHTVEF